MKSFKYKILILFLSTAILLTGCSTTTANQTINNNQNTISGIAIGTIAGVILGNNIGGGSKSRNKIIGAVIGATIGGAIGYNLDEQARQLQEELKAQKAQKDAQIKEISNHIVVLKNDNFVKIIFKNPNFFESGDDIPNIESAKKLTILAKVLKKYPSTLVQVTGHTDNVGNYNYNKKLSQKRATNVGELIYSSDISNQIFSKGCSYDKPIAPNNSSENRALNRRVEVFLFPNEQSVFDTCEAN